MSSLKIDQKSCYYRSEIIIEFKELDNLLIEIFQTTSSLIDEQKLVNGEEGCLCNIDLEYVDEGAKQGLVDASLIDEKHRVLIKQNITKLLDIILE